MRLVRLHLNDNLPSVEGLLVSRRTRRYGDHYLVELAKVLEAPDRTVTLEGRRVMVPRERVVLVQELK